MPSASDAEQAERAVLIGGSYIGCEVAASLTAALGVKCTIVMQEERARSSARSAARSAASSRACSRSTGSRSHGGDELERFEGSDGRVRRVVTKGGLELDCDWWSIGAGVMPDVMLARSAGLELGEAGGVRCSSRLETSVPGVYAAGDICEYDSPVHGRALRIEHWDVAFNHGKTAALNMLGQGVEHESIPYFFSDLADWASMEYVGPGVGRAGDPRLAGRRRVHGLLPRRTRRVTAALTRRPLGRPRARAAPHGRDRGTGPRRAGGSGFGPGRAGSTGS